MMQLPAISTVTVLLATVQTVGVVVVKVTALPEAAPVALTVPVPPTLIVGAVPKLMVCVPFATAMVCVICGAAL